MTNSLPHTPPSPEQLSYLKDLCEATGQSGTYPKTSGEASKEITHLKKVKRTSRSDRRREVQSVRRVMASGRGDGARIRDDELSGYGSTSTWADPWSDERRAEEEEERTRRDQHAY